VTTVPGLPQYDLHHIGIVVADIEAAVKKYAALGFQGGERFEMTEQGVIAVTYHAGPGYVELIQPTDPDGAIARFMQKRGEGMHHVAYRVDDVAAKLAELSEAGLRLIDAAPRRGAHDWKIAFIHPESCNGVLTELVQVS
jgi:methylmalonyl-CoA/ethylmalonyl-CoA epimerase